MSNKTRKWRSAIAMVLVICMLFSIFPVAAFAQDDNTPAAINYVSLGDSMTNGYGLPGYDRNSGVEDYGDEAYPNQFAEWLENSVEDSTVNHAQLAMSGIRAEDLHWLLELDYNDANAINLIQELIDGDWNDKWYDEFSTGDYWTLEEICNHSRTDATYDAIKTKLVAEDKWDSYVPATHENGEKRAQKVALIAKYYQENVTEADIISLGIGNGNFGVFALGRIMEAIGFNGGTPEAAMVYNVERAITECGPEVQEMILNLKDDLYDAVAEYGIIVDDGDDANTTMVEALANTMVYTGLSYVLNYAGSIEAILQLNPDAEIILVALMNTFADDNAATDDVTIGDLLEAVFPPLNAYIAALPTVMQLAGNEVYADARFYYAEAPYVECMVDVFDEMVAERDS
ncbi:MAG: hypothetical protein IJ936_03990, partial [Peptococcaceae bacterium]|nr:hypothetical protein [Peptococcaceae bacterium]